MLQYCLILRDYEIILSRVKPVSPLPICEIRLPAHRKQEAAVMGAAFHLYSPSVLTYSRSLPTWRVSKNISL